MKPVTVLIPGSSNRHCPVIETIPSIPGNPWIVLNISTDPGKQLPKAYRLSELQEVNPSMAIINETPHDEPDGTVTENTIEAQYGLAQGGDWLAAQQAQLPEQELDADPDEPVKLISEVIEPSEHLFAQQAAAETAQRIQDLEAKVASLMRSRDRYKRLYESVKQPATTGTLLLEMPSRRGFQEGTLRVTFHPEDMGIQGNTSSAQAAAVSFVDSDGDWEYNIEQEQPVTANLTFADLLRNGFTTDQIKDRLNEQALAAGQDAFEKALADAPPIVMQPLLSKGDAS